MFKLVVCVVGYFLFVLVVLFVIGLGIVVLEYGFVNLGDVLLVYKMGGEGLFVFFENN